MAYLNLYPKLLAVFGGFRKSFSIFWHYYPSRIYLLVAIVLEALSFWQAFWLKANLSGDLVVLRYKIDFGADLVGDPGLILNYPFISLAVLILNSSLAIFFSLRDDKKVLVHLFLASAAVFNLFMSLYLLSVFIINFR